MLGEKIKKIKSLLPSFKEKQRYLTFKVISDTKLTKMDTYNAIEKATKDLVGNLGLANIGFLKLNHWENNQGIIRVNSTGADTLKASLATIDNINNHKAIIKSIKLSGLLNKAKGGLQ